MQVKGLYADPSPMWKTQGWESFPILGYLATALCPSCLRNCPLDSSWQLVGHSKQYLPYSIIGSLRTPTLFLQKICITQFLWCIHT